jgi:hypothetical protein
MRRDLRPYALAGCLYAALALWLFAASLRCADECFVDHVALYGDFSAFARNDTRLNTWILAWVQHGLLSAPSALCRELALACLDLQPAFAAAARGETELFLDTQHPNARGFALAARATAEFLTPPR